MERKRQKLMGQGKGSSTEQQTKQTVIIKILIRRIYKTKRGMDRAALTIPCPMHSRATINFPPSRPWPTLPPRTHHDGTWY